MHDRQSLAGPCKRNRVSRHEKQIRPFGRQRQGEPDLRPEPSEGDPHHIHAETGAWPRGEEPPAKLWRRGGETRADLAGVDLGPCHDGTSRRVDVDRNSFQLPPSQLSNDLKLSTVLNSVRAAAVLLTGLATTYVLQIGRLAAPPHAPHPVILAVWAAEATALASNPEYFFPPPQVLPVGPRNTPPPIPLYPPLPTPPS